MSKLTQNLQNMESIDCNMIDTTNSNANPKIISHSKHVVDGKEIIYVDPAYIHCEETTSFNAHYSACNI